MQSKAVDQLTRRVLAAIEGVGLRKDESTTGAMAAAAVQWLRAGRGVAPATDQAADVLGRLCTSARHPYQRCARLDVGPRAIIGAIDVVVVVGAGFLCGGRHFAFRRPCHVLAHHALSGVTVFALRYASTAALRYNTFRPCRTNGMPRPR